MKHLGLVPILLLLGVGITSGPVAADLTASQYVPLAADVGETVMVTVTLTYIGSNSTQVVITPGLPAGVETDSPEGLASELFPGIPSPISYPIRAVQSGTYLLSSQVEYSEEGIWRNLRLESPFTAIGEQSPQSPQPIEPQPDSEMPGETPGDLGAEIPGTPETPIGEAPGTPGSETPPQSPEPFPGEIEPGPPGETDTVQVQG